MKTYALHEARAQFSALYEAALHGEPQRVVRHGKGAVLIISEDEWNRRLAEQPSLITLLAAMGLTDDDLPTRQPETRFGEDIE